MSDVQLVLAIGTPTLAVLIGILVNRWHVEDVIDARLKHLEER